jgi:hypothetical protein
MGEEEIMFSGLGLGSLPIETSKICGAEGFGEQMSFEKEGDKRRQ